MAPTPPAHPAATNPRSPLAIIFPVFAALACILYVPALVIHVRGRNFAASVLMISFIVPNVFNFINPLIWPTEFPEGWWNGTGLCDIEVKLQLAFSTANVGAVACIFRQLAIILDSNRTTLTPSSSQRLRKRMFEFGFCVGAPTYLMLAHYFVQTSRYYIYSVEGCRPAFDDSWVSVALIFIWPLILCIVATSYGGLATYRLIKYRRQFAVIFAASTSNMTKSLFIRLFTLSTSLILIYLPLTIFTFHQNVSFPRHPYSWKLVHPSNWSDLIEMVAGQVDGGFDRWVQIGTVFLVFPFFGLGQDAKALYRSWLLKMKMDFFTKLRKTSSGQTPLVAQQNPSIPGAEGRHRSDAQQDSVTDISITLHGDEPIEKTPSANSPPGFTGSPRSWQGMAPGTDQRVRQPWQEIHSKTRVRHAPTFQIWSDEELEPPVSSTQAIKPQNEFELSEHMVHQQF